jgi:hypothetical protein
MDILAVLTTYSIAPDQCDTNRTSASQDFTLSADPGCDLLPQKSATGVRFQ